MDIANDLIGFLSNPAWNALSFFLGLWGGYHFALANDRRKERNTAAAPVVAFLLREREGPNPCLARPSIAELWGLDVRLSFWRRRAFGAAWKRYCQACEQAKQQDPLGQMRYGNADAIADAAGDCLGLLKPG